jgi:hypothetical protein
LAEEEGAIPWPVDSLAPKNYYPGLKTHGKATLVQPDRQRKNEARLSVRNSISGPEGGAKPSHFGASFEWLILGPARQLLNPKPPTDESRALQAHLEELTKQHGKNYPELAMAIKADQGPLVIVPTPAQTAMVLNASA